MKHRIRAISALLGWTLAGLLVAPGARAADPVQSITASPTTERLTLSAGEAYSGLVTITNTGQTAYNFNVSSSPFSVSGEDYNQSFSARPDLIDASKWFSFARTSYHADPTQETAVAYHVAIPADVAGGGYYAALFAEAQPSNSGQGITAHKRVGVLFYLTISGKTVSSGKLIDHSVPIVHTRPPLVATTHIQNTGNVHFDATVSLVVSDVLGNTKARLENTSLIFPGSTRKINLEWTKAPTFGLFKITGTVKYLDTTTNLPARYTLMLSATAFVVMFLAVAALAAYAYLTRKRRNNVVRRRRR